MKKILWNNDIKIYQGNDCQIQSDWSYRVKSKVQITTYVYFVYVKFSHIRSQHSMPHSLLTSRLKQFVWKKPQPRVCSLIGQHHGEHLKITREHYKIGRNGRIMYYSGRRGCIRVNIITWFLSTAFWVNIKFGSKWTEIGAKMENK